MTRLYCPTCKAMKEVSIEGERTYTLECTHTRPRAIPPSNGNQPVPIEPPAFAKWYQHHIDPQGLQKDAESLKMVEEGARAFIANEENSNLAWKAKDSYRTKLAVVVKGERYNCEHD